MEAKIFDQGQQLKEWQTQIKLVYKDIRKTEIQYEKKQYELQQQIKELNSHVRQQRKELKEKDTQMMLQKHQEAVELSKQQLAENYTLTSSYVSSSYQGSPDGKRLAVDKNENENEVGGDAGNEGTDQGLIKLQVADQPDGEGAQQQQ